MPGRPTKQTDNGCCCRRDCGAFYLDHVGLFDSRCVRVCRSDERRKSTEELDRSIEQTWNEQVELAALHGKVLYNGRLCRLIGSDSVDSALSLTVGEVSYREFVGTNLTQARVRYLHGPEAMADPLGVSAVVVTEDGFILLGVRSRSVFACPGQIHPIGGIMAPSRDAAAVPDPFAAIAAELHEELNLQGESIRQCVCMGLVRDKGTVQPELIFDIGLAGDVEAVRKGAAGAADAAEHDKIVQLRDHPGSVVTYLEKHSGQMTPVATAALLLHGQRHWGTGWFTAVRGYLKDVI